MWIAVGLVITLIVEFPIFWFFGFRSKRFLLTFLISNIVTNITINVVLLFMDIDVYTIVMIIGEILVAVVETSAYLFVEKKKWELIPLTIGANILSFSIGCVFYSPMVMGWLHMLF